MRKQVATRIRHQCSQRRKAIGHGGRVCKHGHRSLVRARREARKAAVRPVSRVWFDLSDQDAFRRCIELSLKWMAPRSQVTLPPEAWNGASFDVTDVMGANPARAIRIDATDGTLWGARLDWPDPEQPRTWVSEFFAERRAGGLARFGAQLTCVVRGACPPFEITRPTVVRHVLQTLSAEADGWAIADTATDLERPAIEDLVTLLYKPARRLPVVAISETGDRTMQILPDAVARLIAGAAHVVHLSSDASWELTRSLGKRMSVFNGAVRLYLPGLTDETEDPFQHPLWLMQPADEENLTNGENLTKVLVERVLPAAFFHGTEPDTFPRFALLRDAAARSELIKRPAKDANERLRLEFEILELEHDEAVEERNSWQSLAQEEEAKRVAVDAEIERLKEENRRLEAKAAILEHRVNSAPALSVEHSSADRELQSYDELEDWADEVLGEHIYIHQAALKDCKKNGHDNMLKRVSAALIVIRDYLVPARMHGGLDRRNQLRAKLGYLGMEDGACFADKDEAKHTPGYSVQYDGQSRILYDHIKYGNGYDNANQIRIYYFWDEQRKRIVVGKMPSHLRNNMTN